MHEKTIYICVRGITFFTRSPKIMLILGPLLVRCCLRVGCTNLDHYKFIRSIMWQEFL